MAVSDIWWTAPAESDDGEVIMVTGRDEVGRFMESGKYPDRVELTWRYSGSGMPDGDTADLIDRADTLLRETLTKERGVILTGIYTGAGERNWVFYVKNTRIFQAMINRAWQSLPLLPVTITAEHDPAWEEYSEMRELTYIPPGD